MSDVTSHSRFGKWVQKLNRMSPDQKAIFSVGAAAAAKGRSDIAGQIEALQNEASGYSRDTSRMVTEANMDAAKKSWEDEKSMIPMAHIMGGINMASGLLEGYGRMTRENKRAGLLNKILNNQLITE